MRILNKIRAEVTWTTGFLKYVGTMIFEKEDANVCCVRYADDIDGFVVNDINHDSKGDKIFKTRRILDLSQYDEWVAPLIDKGYSMVALKYMGER